MFENKIKITAPFLQHYINLIRKEMLPFQWSVLNDEADIKIERFKKIIGVIPHDVKTKLVAEAREQGIENFGQ